MADVNGDGRLDIYVSAVNDLSMKSRNALYINNGDRTFTDRAAQYGLDQAGYSTQSAFFDYDADGDLASLPPRRSLRLALAGLLVASVAVAVWGWLRPLRSEPRPVMRFSVVFPAL